MQHKEYEKISMTFGMMKLFCILIVVVLPWDAISIKIHQVWTSLVVQWIRIHPQFWPAHANFTLDNNHFRVILFVVVVQLCPTLCDSMDCSMPGLPVSHYLPEFSQIHVR